MFEEGQGSCRAVEPMLMMTLPYLKMSFFELNCKDKLYKFVVHIIKYRALKSL
jgi:hypothetical protein